MARIQLDAMIDVVGHSIGRDRAIRPDRPVPCGMGLCRGPTVPTAQPRVLQYLLADRAARPGMSDHLFGPAVPRDSGQQRLSCAENRHPHLRPCTASEHARGNRRGDRRQSPSDCPHVPGRSGACSPVRAPVPGQDNELSAQIQLLPSRHRPVAGSRFLCADERAIDCLELAHIAYNRLDRAEFILRRPTSITDADGKALCQVLHYSQTREHPVRHELFAGEEK